MAYRNYSVANGFTVAKDGNGDFTTLAAALTAAVSGQTIFIRPGTYTENPTLKSGVNLCAFNCDALTPNVTIVGNCTATFAGTASLSGLRLQTNSAALLTVSGSAATIINLNNCFLNATNNTGITFSSSSTSGKINITNCNGDLGTTGIAIYTMSSLGFLNIISSNFTNTGSSVTASSMTGSGGVVNLYFSSFFSAFSTASASAMYLDKCYVQCSPINTTAFSFSGTGTSSIRETNIESGSASAITIASSSLLNLFQSVISSSNTNCITGAGSLNYSDIVFSGSSTVINTTTQTGGTLIGGKFQAPSAGFIGERISSGLVTSVSIANSTIVNLTSIVLTPGNWDISLIIEFSGMTTGTYILTGISPNSASLTGVNQGDNGAEFPFLSQASAAQTLVIPSYRVSITANTTYYAVGNAVYTAGTGTMSGRLSAVRVG